jgi:BirA family biotin operon repressor/biotin-[acetyl-CoA-carboxylase] ligase
VDLGDTSTTLRQELNDQVNLETAFTSLLTAMDEYYHDLRKMEFKKILDDWRIHQDTLGRVVRIETQKGNFEGLAEDLDENGALMLRNNNNERIKIMAGDCIHLEGSGGKQWI